MNRGIFLRLLLIAGLLLGLPQLAAAQTACGYSLGSGIYDKWMQTGGEQGRLGCPEINESEAGKSPQGTTGRYARFRGGAYIVWHGSGRLAGRSFVVGGCFFNLERGEGGTGGWLGFPTSDEYDVAGGRRQDWEGGYGLWDAQTRICRAYRNAGPEVNEGGERQEVLSPGWDIFSVPLKYGAVVWSLTDAGGGRMRFRVRYELQGSQPNQKFQVGIHFFELSGQRLADINEFGGWKNGGRETLTREGVTAKILAAWDFGPLVTDGNGNGRASFEYLVPAATYFMQFTVRNGDCNVPRGITNGCPAVFRTGGKFAAGFSGNSGGGGGICDDPRTQAIMDEWLAQANPPENRQPGWRVRYEPWGRLVGTSPSANINAPYRPDTRLTRCEYLWSIAVTLRSTNLGTLREYVEQRRR